MLFRTWSQADAYDSSDYMETRLLCGYYFLYFICFHIQKQLILHTLAINIKVLTELRLGILNMPHQIVG